MSDFRVRATPIATATLLALVALTAAAVAIGHRDAALVLLLATVATSELCRVASAFDVRRAVADSERRSLAALARPVSPRGRSDGGPR